MGRFVDKPAAAPWLTPYLTLRDMGKTLKAYREAFGFEPKVVREDRGVPTHVEILYQGQAIAMGGPEGSSEGDARSPATLGMNAPQTFYVFVDNVDAHHANAVGKGVRIKSEPKDQEWGDRAYVAADPSGYLWMFATRLAR